MGVSCKSIIRNPRTPSNLKSLEKILVRCEIDAATIVGLSPVQLKKEIVELLKDEAIKVERNARSKLIVGIATESRSVPPSLVYAVEVALREPAALPRAIDEIQSGNVDSWRHQTVSGLLVPPIDGEKVARALTQEAIRQVSAFLQDWSAQNAPPQDDDDEPPKPKPPVDPTIEEIRKRLEAILERLGVGDASKASVDKLEVAGTQVRFEATITHRQKASAVERIFGGKYRYSIKTGVKGQFDLADPNLDHVKVCTKLPPLLGSHEVCVPLTGLAGVIN